MVFLDKPISMRRQWAIKSNGGGGDSAVEKYGGKRKPCYKLAWMTFRDCFE